MNFLNIEKKLRAFHAISNIKKKQNWCKKNFKFFSGLTHFFIFFLEKQFFCVLFV